MAQGDNCHNCVYAWWDPCQALAQFAIGFPSRPTCANQPGHYGRPASTPVGRVCSNYRRKPEEPGAEAKTIILTNGMTAYVDACDYEELSQYSWRMVSGGYAGRYEKRKFILMHRQIMNPPPGMIVDHIHGNRLDNTRAHLRVCTYSENARNRAKNANSASRYIGVRYWTKRKKWVAIVRLDGKDKFVGSFDDELEAARAHDYAAVLYLDDFARLNFPEEWPPERRAEVRAAAAVGANHHSPSRKKTKGETPSKRRATKTAPKTRRAADRKARTPKKKSRAQTRGRRAGKQTRKTPKQRRG